MAPTMSHPLLSSGRSPYLVALATHQHEPYKTRLDKSETASIGGALYKCFSFRFSHAPRVVRGKISYQKYSQTDSCKIFDSCPFDSFCFDQGVVQRSYNAFAVRVQESLASTPRRGVKVAGSTAAGTRTVVPAGKTTEGTLCIELRIRLHQDGTMSKLLQNLANVRLPFPSASIPGTWYIVCRTRSSCSSIVEVQLDFLTLNLLRSSVLHPEPDFRNPCRCRKATRGIIPRPRPGIYRRVLESSP